MFTVIICAFVTRVFQNEAMMAKGRALYNVQYQDPATGWNRYLSVFGPAGLAVDGEKVAWLGRVDRQPDGRTRDAQGRAASYVTNVQFVGECPADLALQVHAAELEAAAPVSESASAMPAKASKKATAKAGK